jgi:hypothetical protein
LTDNTPEPEIVSFAAMKHAADYIDYVDEMMVRALGELAVSKAQRTAARVACMILAKRPAQIHERSLYQQAGFRDLRDKKLRDQVFNELQQAGWLRRKRSSSQGRPSNDWEINPQLLQEL